MRRARVKAEGEAFYHVMSRCALQEHLLTEEVKGMFMTILRRAEQFSGVRILDYCVMDNHFHVLVKVPKRRAVSNEELDARIKTLYGERKALRMFARWGILSDAGAIATVEREREALRKRMYDLSEFMKTFKQRFSLWYCSNHGNLEGTIWQGPFHSVLIEGSHDALGAVSTYIALNPVRAGLVKDPGKYAWSGYGAACAGDMPAKAALLSSMGGRRSEDEKWKAFHAMVSSAAALHPNARKSSEVAAVRKAPAPATAQKVHSQMTNLGPLFRDRDLSRGVAFGSDAFVSAAIKGASKTPVVHTHPKMFSAGDDKVLLFCAGRRRA